MSKKLYQNNKKVQNQFRYQTFFLDCYVKELDELGANVLVVYVIFILLPSLCVEFELNVGQNYVFCEIFFNGLKYTNFVFTLHNNVLNYRRAY